MGYCELVGAIKFYVALIKVTYSINSFTFNKVFVNVGLSS